MTTPAINFDASIQSATGQWLTQSCTGVITNNGSSTSDNLHRQETRPASVNNPINRGGWRNPSAWSHSKLVDNRQPPGTLTRIRQNPSGSCPKGRYEFYTNGNQMLLTKTSFPAFLSGLEGRAVSRALLKLKHQQVNLAVAFAERDQVKAMFATNARRIANQVNNYKRKRPKDWKQVVARIGVGTKKAPLKPSRKAKGGRVTKYFGGTPNSWLELQYGWKPLISDVAGACNELSQRETGRNPYLAKVTGVAGGESTNTWRKNHNFSSLYGFDVTDRWKHRCRVSLYYELRNPVLAKFASLGLTNPFELAWEKMKYSFVIDWFLPVGNWLSTLDADFGWDFHSGTLTKFISGGSTSVWHNLGIPIQDVGAFWTGPNYEATGFSMARTLYNAAPWGGIPRFKNPLSSQHVANALALLVQAFRR